MTRYRIAWFSLAILSGICGAAFMPEGPWWRRMAAVFFYILMTQFVRQAQEKKALP